MNHDPTICRQYFYCSQRRHRIRYTLFDRKNFFLSTLLSDCLINSENKRTVISHLWTALIDKGNVTINLLTFRSSRSSLTSVKSFFQFTSVTDLTVHRLSRKELLIELFSLRNQVGTSLRTRRFYDQRLETYNDNRVWREITEKRRRFLKRKRIE